MRRSRVGRRLRARRRQRRPMATVLRGGGTAARRRFATNRQRVTDYDALRPFVADRLRAPRGSTGSSVERRRRAVRVGPELRGAVRRSAARRARDDREGRARDDRPAARAGRADQAVRYTGRGPDAAADAGPAHRCGPHHDLGFSADAIADCGVSRSSDRHGNLRRSQTTPETIERAKRQAAERRARNDKRPRLRRVSREVAVPLVRQVAQALRAEGSPSTSSHRRAASD